MKAYDVLSIDAWGNEEEGYEWNSWYRVGKVEVDINSPTAIVLKAMHDQGFITSPDLGDIEDDQFNLVIVDKKTREPVFAIEYGNTI